MKIAVLGGLGYVGSIISEELRKEHEVVVYDNNIFGRQGLKFGFKVENKDIFKEKLIKGFDRVVWVLDIDVEQFYWSEVSKCYIEENIRCFLEYSSGYGERMIFVSHNYNGNNITYRDFLSTKTQIVKNYKNDVWLLPELFGPSPSMRFDTLINGMFINAYINGGIFVQDWLKRLPICSVAVAGKVIAKCASNDVRITFECPVNCCLSVLEYSEIVAKVFKDKCEVILSDDFKIYKYSEEELSKYSYHDFGEFGIKESMEYMIRALDKGTIDDVTKDYYNNSQIVQNFVASNSFFEFVNSIGKTDVGDL